jgi:hypothetical protein
MSVFIRQCEIEIVADFHCLETALRELAQKAAINPANVRDFLCSLNSSAALSIYECRGIPRDGNVEIVAKPSVQLATFLTSVASF